MTSVRVGLIGSVDPAAKPTTTSQQTEAIILEYGESYPCGEGGGG